MIAKGHGEIQDSETILEMASQVFAFTMQTPTDFEQ